MRTVVRVTAKQPQLIANTPTAKEKADFLPAYAGVFDSSCDSIKKQKKTNC